MGASVVRAQRPCQPRSLHVKSLYPQTATACSSPSMGKETEYIDDSPFFKYSVEVKEIKRSVKLRPALAGTCVLHTSSNLNRNHNNLPPRESIKSSPSSLLTCCTGSAAQPPPTQLYLCRSAVSFPFRFLRVGTPPAVLAGYGPPSSVMELRRSAHSI